MKVISNLQIASVKGGNGIDAQEWGCLFMLMDARRESTSASEWHTYDRMIRHFAAVYRAD